jgi:hypothetical protein
MHRPRALLLLALVWLLPPGTAAGAPGREVPIEASHRRFAEQYAAAARGRDVERYRRLVHPQSLACFTAENRDFFDDWTARAFRWKRDSPYRIVAVRLLGKGAPPSAPPTMATYPVPPTHQIQIDLEMGPTRAASLVAEIASSGGTWLQVVPCPTAEGLASFRSAKQTSAAQEARARTLARGLAPALRAELTDLLKSGHRLDAMRRYAEASSEELTMARRVIDVLEAERK